MAVPFSGGVNQSPVVAEAFEKIVILPIKEI
jgi:hypothetical protein